MATCTISLDFPLRPPRLDELIDGVLEGTGLVAEGHLQSQVFGHYWKWAWEMDENEWRTRIQPIVAPRIKRLYQRDIIRYGSWGIEGDEAEEDDKA
jgi:hypothetical protein